jgi:maleate isomerase
VISVGVLTPHAATGPEEELPLMAPGVVETKVERISVGAADQSAADLRGLTRPPVPDEAAEAVAARGVEAIAYASTSSAYAIGFDEEIAMVSRLSRRVALPVVSTCASAVVAFRHLGVARLALVHPPWFHGDLNELGAAYFGSQGFEVVLSASANLAQDPARIEPSDVLAWASSHVPDDADGVFIGGNGFRAAGAIEELEAALARPVLESNQVLLWNVIAETGVELAVRGYGELLRRAGRESRSGSTMVGGGGVDRGDADGEPAQHTST